MTRHPPVGLGETDDTVGVASQVGEALPTVLSVDELAVLLRLERKTVYAAIRRREIPGVRRFGRVIRVCRSTVIDWLANGQGSVPRSRR